MSVVEGLRISRLEIPARQAGSLLWQGDRLVDWTAGGNIFHLDGTFQRSTFYFPFPFDAACATPDGKYAIVYQRCGTKGLLMRDGKLLRELNRSYYHAHVYDYPICIWQTREGRTLIAHCPEEYCRLDIEDADTGTRLTTDDSRKPRDFFHSRLAVNADATRLLSAGWFWHPWSAVIFYDVAAALRDPKHLDSVNNSAPGSRNVGLAEEGSACWLTTDLVVLGGTAEEDSVPDPEDVERVGELRLHSRGIAVYDVLARQYTKSFVLDEVPGTMMPIGKTHVLCFYKHPRLVSLESGGVVARWDDLDTGKQICSILGDSKAPPMAIDIPNRRFAVFGSEKITVIQIEPSE